MDNASKNNHTNSPVVLVSIGFLLGAVVVGALWLSSRPSDTPRNAIVRDVTVNYMYETDPGSASGQNDLAVESVEFLPGYVVVTDNNGRTQLFAVDRLRRFSYHATKQ